ncbi:DUF5320 domain-containing protein [Candidatus Latescibacterota bacterium]
MSLKKSHIFAMFFIIAITIFTFTESVLARWGDGAGPEGLGQKTGRGLGYCAGYSTAGYMNNVVPRRGFANLNFQRGGRGYRNIYRATGLTRWQRSSTAISGNVSQPVISKAQRLEALKIQAENIKKELDEITRLIKEIDSEK